MTKDEQYNVIHPQKKTRRIEFPLSQGTGVGVVGASITRWLRCSRWWSMNKRPIEMYNSAKSDSPGMTLSTPLLI